MEHHITTPLQKEDLEKISAGDTVYLSGVLYTGRDAAHKRMVEYVEQGKDLPFDLKGAAIYYTGPCPAPPGEVIGSCGPTTSYRMDKFAPTLLDLGLSAMIGKGKRSSEVVDAMVKNHAIYLAATGGAGALLAQCVKSCKIIAFEDLMSEAIRELTVEDIPLLCTIDSRGRSLYR